MKRCTILAHLLAVALLVVACGGGSDTEPAVAAGGGESSEDEPDQGAPALRGDAGIPIACFESDDAFVQCDLDGLVPADCFDDDGFLLDECFPDEPDPATVAAESIDPAEDAIRLAFDPSNDAFGFFNYGDEDGVVNLTPVEMQRMFGDDICANQVDGCTLTPPARQWMEQMNQAMSGGHCEGMAVLSSLIYFDYFSAGDFGDADVTAELEFDGNELLQREIAYWFVTQATNPGASQRINESPRAVVDALMEAFEADQAADDWWVMGIYKRDFTGGHAITPYAVEDNGDGTYSVFVYDNNYPLTSRVMTVDYEANTWRYEASPNPDIEADLYEGDEDTQTLEIVAIGPRLVEQEQSFSDVARSGLGGTAGAPGAGGIEVWLEGDSNLLITAPDGRRIGYLTDGSFVNEIEGASANPLKFVVDVWDIDDEPVYRLPPDMTEFTITVDGSQLSDVGTSDVALIGPGFNMVVEELLLGPGQQDVIEITVEDGDFFALNYQSDFSDSPDIWFGLVTDEADYEFITRAADIEAGGSFNVALDFANGDFILNTFDQQEYGIYELLMLRIDDDGEHVFGHDEIELLPDDTMYANFLEWEGEGSVMYLDFDFGSDGTFDDTIALEDEADSFFDAE